MDRTRRIIVFSAALVVAVATVVTIGISVEAIRDSVQFGRILRRIERGDTATSTLLEAAEFARTTGNWQTLMRVAWELEEPRRWGAVYALAQPAMQRFPDDTRWRYAGALAALRRGSRSDARELLPLDGDTPAEDLPQFLRVLTEIDPDQPEASRERLARFSELPPEYTVLRAIAAAETAPSGETLRTAWDATFLGAYGVNAALEAAAAGDREGTRALMTRVREAEVLPSAERESAPLYLAVWLRDIDWLFEQLRSLSGTRAVEPDILLIHADGLILQGRLREARRFYRELQQVAAEHDAIAFLNDAAITAQIGDGNPVSILREGLQFHGTSAVLRGELAGVLTARGERLEAAQILGPSLVVRSEGEQRHRDWILTRAVLGPRRPLSRLESDLWQYLNDHPEADLVAQYLARFLATRGDPTGIDRLRGRYPPQHAEWATTLHLHSARQRGNLSRAEALLEQYPENSWTARYNRVLFGLHHLPEAEVADALQDLEEWINRGPALSETAFTRAQFQTLLLRVEYERIAGDGEAAIDALQRAEQLAPDDLSLASYERLIAPPQ